METFTEYILTFVLFCPSFIRLVLIAAALKSGKVFNKKSSAFKAGLMLSILGSIISPGFPAYMIYQWSQCSPGCASGLIFIFVIPIIWLIAIVAEICFQKGKL